MNVNLEIIPWLIGAGKETFTWHFLMPLCEKFKEWKKIAPHVIDSNAYPSIPDGYEVYYHCKQGKITWDPAKACPLTFLSPERRWDGEDMIMKGLRSLPVANACFLDYLMENMDRIPGGLIGADSRVDTYFGGTIYKQKCGGGLFIRTMASGTDGKVAEYMQWIDSTIDMNQLVALVRK